MIVGISYKPRLRTFTSGRWFRTSGSASVPYERWSHHASGSIAPVGASGPVGLRAHYRLEHPERATAPTTGAEGGRAPTEPSLGPTFARANGGASKTPKGA